MRIAGWRLKWNERSDRHIRNMSFIVADKASHLLRRMCADTHLGASNRFNIKLATGEQSIDIKRRRAHPVLPA